MDTQVDAGITNQSHNLTQRIVQRLQCTSNVQLYLNHLMFYCYAASIAFGEKNDIKWYRQAQGTVSPEVPGFDPVVLISLLVEDNDREWRALEDTDKGKLREITRQVMCVYGLMEPHDLYAQARSEQPWTMTRPKACINPELLHCWAIGTFITCVQMPRMLRIPDFKSAEAPTYPEFGTLTELATYCAPMWKCRDTTNGCRRRNDEAHAPASKSSVEIGCSTYLRKTKRQASTGARRT